MLCPAVVLTAKRAAALQVAIALSLLLSELAAPPFDQLVCTFSAKPQLHRVTGDTLAERVRTGVLCLEAVI